MAPAHASRGCVYFELLIQLDEELIAEIRQFGDRMIIEVQKIEMSADTAMCRDIVDHA